MQKNDSRSTTLLALIAVILTAGTFKEEMKRVFLWQGSWDLLQVFIAFSLFYGFLLMMYLLLESSENVPVFRWLDKISKQTKIIVDTIFSASIFLIIGFSAVALLLTLLAIPAVLQALVYILTLGPFVIVYYKQIKGIVDDLKS